MAFPDTDLATQWTQGEDVNATAMNQRIDQQLNILASRIRALNLGLGVGMSRIRTTTQPVPTSTYTYCQSFQTGLYNSGGFSYGAGIFTNTTGAPMLAQWSATVPWPAVAGAHRKICAIFLNGTLSTNYEGRQDFNATASAPNAVITAGGMVALQAGDAVSLALFQDSGVQVPVNTGMVFSIVKAG